MDGHIPLLRGSMSSEEPSGSSVIYEAAVASVHHTAEVAQRARRPHTKDQGRSTGPRQPQLQEDEENPDGR